MVINFIRVAIFMVILTRFNGYIIYIIYNIGRCRNNRR